jgi:hypothetical protein
MAQEGYTRLLGVLREELEPELPGSLKLMAERHGDRIDITAVANGLKPAAGLRLRLLLIEDVVRYQGSNGQRLHHHVVRAFPAGVEGVEVHDGAARHETTINLVDLRKSLADELGQHGAFQDKELPLELKRLKMVALVQNDESQDVLQAVQIDVPDS